MGGRMQHGPRLQLLLLLVLAASTLQQAACATAPPPEPQVILSSPYKPAKTDAEMAPVYRDNLDLDLGPHKEHIKAQGKPYTLKDLYTTAAVLRPIKYFKHLTLFVIKDNVPHTAPFYGLPVPPTPRRVAAMKEAIVNATQAGVKFPDCIFIMNTWDEPRCSTKKRPAQRCAAPVLSVIKYWDYSAQSSFYTDILVPFFNHRYEEMVEYPWDLKDPRALLRAAVQNGMPPNNTRLWLVRLGATPEGQPLLDAGITANLKESVKVELTPQVPLRDHPKWKFLISADGFTASCRFGKLLGMNSVILKEESRWVEHYYRSLKPNTHYIGFNKATALRVLQSLGSKWSEPQLKAMVQGCQSFQQTFLSQLSKAVYLRKALEEYRSLFVPGSMQALVRRLDTAKLGDLDYLLLQLEGA